MKEKIIAEGYIYMESGCENGPTPVLWNPEIKYDEEFALSFIAEEEFVENSGVVNSEELIKKIKKLYPDLIEKVESYNDYDGKQKEMIELKKPFFLGIDFKNGKKYKIIEVK